MKVAFLATDNREHYRDYAATIPRFGTAPEALLQGFAELPEVEIHVVCCTQKPLISPRQIAPNIFYHSLLVPKIGWMRTLYQGCVRAVRKKLATIQPAVVHGQGTERECAISAVFSGFPNVLTIHGNMRLIAKVNRAPLVSYLGISAVLEKIVVPRSNGVVCISRYTENAVKSLNQRKTWVVPNAVDARFFTVEREKPHGAVMLCVGHVILRKNQNAFMRALDELAQRMVFELIFIGAASEKEPYGAEFFALLRQRPWCKHVGLADQESLRNYFKTASMLAMPSLEENCPMVVLEAMAAGLPVVAANVGGVPDLVEDNVTGLLCDPNDPESMRNAVEDILRNQDNAEKIAQAARQRAQHLFHPSVVARRHLEIYRGILTRAQ